MKKLKELDKFDKPREKLLQKGVSSLKNEELLSVLLGSGVAGKDVRQLSKEIIKLLDDDFENISIDKLQHIHGLGTAKSAQIIASIELSRRYLIKNNATIKSAEDVYNELKDYTKKEQEYFILITLDGASHIVNKRVLFIGTINQSLVHPREVFANAISDRSASIIIAHNHPSGTLKPSNADIQITDRLQKVAKIVGIELLDHVIITKDGYYSFSENALL